eukprot:TRINITY_DN11832_c0_g4_i1.p1 TRINITY_DN11832_c0_g4~~TRINITY_DN11832_c0_g4_i1.p1  ORF type:complete len:126 (-),score=13.37 TRINITY_DN11832_c0_g4_i1:303-680(-)
MTSKPRHHLIPPPIFPPAHTRHMIHWVNAVLMERLVEETNVVPPQPPIRRQHQLGFTSGEDAVELLHAARFELALDVQMRVEHPVHIEEDQSLGPQGRADRGYLSEQCIDEQIWIVDWRASKTTR